MRVLRSPARSRAVLAWALALPASYFVLGFLAKFHDGFLAVFALSLLVQTGLGVYVRVLIRKFDALRAARPLDLLLLLGLTLSLLAFAARVLAFAIHFPSLFSGAVFALDSTQILPFALGCLLAMISLLYLLGFEGLQRSTIATVVSDLSGGAHIASLFFPVYLLCAYIFNQPTFDVDDIFFDADGLLWRMRFTTDMVRDYYWRSVHPFVLLVIRPCVAFVSMFLNGDRLAAAIVLVAFVGALCVFLVWWFVKLRTGNGMYAALIASLLGASASHLVFASLIETYIFLAALMLGFLILLLKDAPLVALMAVGLASFGITVTNFIASAIALLLSKLDVRRWVLYCAVVLALTIPFALLNNLIYPNSQPYFFIPSALNAEADNTFTPTTQRASAIARVMLLHSIVASRPLILQQEIPFLKVWDFTADPLRLAKYSGVFDRTLAYAWLGLLVLGSFLLLKNFHWRDERYALAFAAILLFNFALHLRYGKDVFLYSPNWTYALVLLMAESWRRLAGARWFHSLLLLFVALLLLNNSRLILTMLEASALHIK